MPHITLCSSPLHPYRNTDAFFLVPLSPSFLLSAAFRPARKSSALFPIPKPPCSVPPTPHPPNRCCNATLSPPVQILPPPFFFLQKAAASLCPILSPICASSKSNSVSLKNKKKTPYLCVLKANDTTPSFNFSSTPSSIPPHYPPPPSILTMPVSSNGFIPLCVSAFAIYPAPFRYRFNTVRASPCRESLPAHTPAIKASDTQSLLQSPFPHPYPVSE